MTEVMQHIVTKPYPLEDFSGGFTDYYVNGPSNRYQKADNFLIERHGDLGKLYQRWGSESYDTAHDFPEASRIKQMARPFTELLAQTATKLYQYVVASGWAEIQGPSAHSAYFSTGGSFDAVYQATWDGHYVFGYANQRPMKLYKNDSGVYCLRTAGIPPTSSTLSCAIGGAGAHHYNYLVILRYDYAVQNVGTFIDRGAYIDEAGFTSRIATTSDDPSSNPNVLSYNHTISTTSSHYDVANIVVELYRTVDGGTTFYLCKTSALNNGGTTSFTDNVADATLQTNEPLYTTSGVVANDQAPFSSFIHISGDTGIAYYGVPKYNGRYYSNRILASIPGDFDSVPRSFFCDVDETVAGISSVRGLPIILCATRIFRIDGQFDLLGRGGMSPSRISDSAGCIDFRSIVQTLDALFWAGNDGFYWTDGYTVQRLTDWDQTFATIKANKSGFGIQGRYDSKNKRIYWTVRLGSGTSENDSMVVMDLKFGTSGATPCTTITGGGSFAPSAIEIETDYLIRADSRGYVFRHRSPLMSDPVVDTLNPTAGWAKQPILFDYRSIATNFGTDSFRKYVPRITVICTNESNLSAQIGSVSDDGRITDTLRPIRFVNGIVWGDADVYWGDSHVVWGLQGVIAEWRRFPSGSIRCQYKQVYLQNAKTAIVSSDIVGTCYTDFANKYVYLTNGAFQWPSNSVGYVIAFAADGYVKEFTILARDDTKITVKDDQNIMPSVIGSAWVIRGIPKDQRCGLQSLTLHAATFGKTQHAYSSTDTGEVGS